MASLKTLKEAVVAAQKKSPKKAAKSSMLSSEYVEGTDAEDDSTDSDSSVEITPKSTKAKDPPTLPIKGSNGSAQTKASSTAPKAASIATSDSESDSGSGSESAASSGSEDSSSDSGGESENKASDSGTTKSTAITGAKRKLTPERQSVKSQPSYEPPNGFEIIRSSSTSTMVASDMFSRSSLSGKQIWHITAPSSIPVDMIKEVSLESVAKGEAALNYKGTDYGFVVNGEGSQTPKKILIAGAGSDYRLAPMEIAQTLQLQQLVNLPALQRNQSQSSGSSQGSTTAYVPAKKAVRQQPEGLRMRFGPLGDPIEDSGKIGLESSSDESSTGQGGGGSEFRMPRGLEAPGVPVKRKHSEVNGSTINGASSPASTRKGQEGKRKKAKHDASHHTPRQPSSSIPEPNMNLDSPDDVQSGAPAQSQSQQTPSKRKETTQERKDRKAKEKRKAQKAKDHRRKDRKQDHKNGEIPSDHNQPKSIAT